MLLDGINNKKNILGGGLSYGFNYKDSCYSDTPSVNGPLISGHILLFLDKRNGPLLHLVGASMHLLHAFHGVLSHTGIMALIELHGVHGMWCYVCIQALRF